MASVLEEYDGDGTRQRGYDAAVKRAGNLGGPMNVPTTMLPAQRIADLAAQVTEAGHALQVARTRCNDALEERAVAEKVFIDVSERLMQAIHEHREGAPENQPYGLR
jgi:hypothetical protein